MGKRHELYKDGQLIEVHDDRVLEEEKNTDISQIKSCASELLSSTDWMITRAAEGGKPVPVEILTVRDAIRKASDEAEKTVNACETLEQLDQCQWVNNFKEV